MILVKLKDGSTFLVEGKRIRLPMDGTLCIDKEKENISNPAAVFKAGSWDYAMEVPRVFDMSIFTSL